jgi:hypothetical protein
MLVTEEHDGLILVPVPVPTEVRSGRRSTDVLVDRLLGAIGVTSSIYAPLTVETASRAGVLRATAQAGRRRPISAIDAQVVASGGERRLPPSGDDRHDRSKPTIAALVDATGRPNIAHDAVGIAGRPDRESRAATGRCPSARTRQVPTD